MAGAVTAPRLRAGRLGPVISAPSVRLPYPEARRLAREHGWREKVLIYLTRGDELLVLEHSEAFAESAGVQVPGGGVDPGERPEGAARRELFEETGVRADSTVHLESHRWLTDDAPSRIRHYFWVVAPAGTPDAWWHEVSAGEDDQGMLFRLSFRPLHDHGLTPGYGWEAALAPLRSRLEVSGGTR